MATTQQTFEEKVTATMEESKAKLRQIEATAKEKGSQAEAAAVSSLQAANENISRKMKDLKTTHASNVARAKADIHEDVEKLKAAIDTFGGPKTKHAR